jgi:hypothetical protein
VAPRWLDRGAPVTNLFPSIPAKGSHYQTVGSNS